MKCSPQPFAFKAKRISPLLAALSLLTAGGCANKAATPAFTADPAAFEFAIRQGADMQITLSECQRIDSSLADKAEQAKSAWYGRNWPQLAAADKSYSEQLSDQTVTYQGATMAPQAVRLLSSVNKEVGLRLDQTRHTFASVLDSCNKRITGYQNGAYDLSKNQNADLYLKSLAQGLPGTTPHPVPTLANGLTAHSQPGRSQYNLEKTVAEWKCVANEILTFKNEWPHEAYGVFCQNDKAIFVTCEWGVCKTH